MIDFNASARPGKPRQLQREYNRLSAALGVRHGERPLPSTAAEIARRQ